jgi:hypothetical protein
VRRAALLTLAAATLAAGCGGSNTLSKGDANAFAQDKLTLEDDVGAIGAIDGDPAEARRLIRSVTKTLAIYQRFKAAGESAGGSVGSNFTAGAGEKALELIEKDVPSLGIGRNDSLGVEGLDDTAVRAYFRYAVRDPRRALRGPAAEHVRDMLNDVQDASPSTKVPTLHNRTVASVLNESAAAIAPYWPDLAARLRVKAKK